MKHSGKKWPMSMMVVLVVLLMAAGCDVAPCEDIQRDYNRAATQESPLVELNDSGAPHLAMAIRLDLLNDLVSGLLGTAIGDALAVNGTLAVGSGQNVPYSLSSTAANLRLDASSACARCLRVRGDIDARVQATLPLVGAQGGPLSGSLDWTIPLAVGRDDAGQVAVFLDTAEALRMGVPQITGRLQGLPDSWGTMVATALMTELASRVADSLDPIRLVGYEMPSLGIQGLEMTPSLFAFDSSSNALILGVHTNLPVSAGSRSQSEYINALSLAEGQNVALAVQPGAVLEAVRVGMQQRKVPRQYSLTGQASNRGPAHVVVDRFQVGSHPNVGDALALGLDFRVFNFGSGWGCFSMDGDALSRFQVRDGRVELEVEGVEFSGSGIASAANWASAQFIEHTQNVVAHTLNDDIVFSPNVGMNLMGQSVGTEAGLLILRGKGSAQR